ncbi:TPA: hypothetical protein ACH3X1_010192 [Trebouxia sp. C0004]
MTDFVSPLSIRALLQDVNVSPNRLYEEPNDCMIDDAVMNLDYYMGLQNTQPAAWPTPLGGDPLPLAGPSDNTVGSTDVRDAANAAAAAATLNIDFLPGPVFQPLMPAQPPAPPAMAHPLSFRADNRQRKQKVLSARQQEVRDDRWRAEKERLKQLEVQEPRRQQRLQALAAARAAVKVKAEARRVKAQAQRQKAAATRVLAAQRAAAVVAAAASSGEAAGGVTTAAASAAAGAEAAGVSGLGLRAVGASARDNGGAAPPLTQPIGRACTRMRVPTKRFQDEVDTAPGLLPNSLVKAIKGRASPTSPTKKASRLEPQTPAKVATRAMSRSPSKGPHTPVSREAVAIFSRASTHSPGVRASSPTGYSQDVDEIQDGRWCEPRRCSCCWASTKASGTGAPTWRKGSIAPFVGMCLCNACGIYEDRHGGSLLDCTKPVRVNRWKEEYNALYGDLAAFGGGGGNKDNGGGHANGSGTVSSRHSGSDSDSSGSDGAGPEHGSSGGASRTAGGAHELRASQVLAGIKYAEAHGSSVQHSSSHLGSRGSSGQGHSPSVYPSSPKASANLVDISRGEPGQSCSPSVQSSLPQGVPFGGTLEGSTGGLHKAASLSFSSAAAPQLTHQPTLAALGTAAQRDRNASFGSSSAVGQQLTTGLSVSFGGALARGTQLDSQPLSNDCAHPLPCSSLENSSGSASAAVTQATKKRAAEVSCAEPNAKRRSSGRQGTTDAGGALRRVDESTAVTGGGAGCNSYAADAGDSAMADGEPKGRRRTVKLNKKHANRAVEDQGCHSGEEAVASR